MKQSNGTFRLKNFFLPEGFAILLFCLFANALYLKMAYLTSFRPMDYGGSQDLAWRFLCGQKFYTDVFYNAGPIFPVTLAFFIKLFGFGKVAVLFHLLFTSSLYILFVYEIARKHLPLPITFLLCLAAATFHWFYPFPNYIHDAYLWGLVAVWALAGRNPFTSSRNVYWSFFVCGLFVVLSCFTKHNIGVPYGLAVLAAAAFSGERTSSLSGFFLGGALASIMVIFFLIPDLHAFFYDNIFSYLAQEQERWAAFLSFRGFFAGFYWIIALVCFAAVYPFLRELANSAALTAGVVFASYFSHHTNTAKPITHLPLLMAFVLLFKVKDENFRKSVRFRTALVLLVLLGLGQVIPSVYSSLQYQKALRAKNTYSIQAAPLAGWRSEPDWGVAMDYFVDKINRFVPKNETLLMLDKMQIIYPLTGRESFKGVLFHFFTYAIQKSISLRQQTYDAVVRNPPDWIVTGYQVTGSISNPDNPSEPFLVTLPYDVLVHLLGLEDFISANYQLIDSMAGYAIFRKKTI